MSRHFRGRVRFAGHYALGKPVFEFVVVNEHTGHVVASDNHCGFSKLHDEAREMVEACGLAWSYGLRQKDLR